MELYWIWLSLRQGITKRQAATLIKYYGDPAAIFDADRQSLLQAGVPEDGLLQTLLDKDLTAARQTLDTCRRQGWQILPIQAAAYPRKLRQVADAPLVLYLWGRLPDVDAGLSIGVVGTRDAGQYGLHHSHKIAGELARAGVTVVSGGAAGVDTAALEGALAQGAPVIAVVAGGLDRLYPAENLSLFHRIAGQGCVLTEYVPGTRCYRYNFLARNRLISGLSDGVLVTEAPVRSGALSTARHAVRQARPVFALPGPVSGGDFAGCHGLIRAGTAELIENGGQILARFGVLPEKKSIDKKSPRAYIDTHKDKPVLSAPQQDLLQLLQEGPLTIGQLAELADVPLQTVTALLMELELSAQVERDGDGKYRLKNV